MIDIEYCKTFDEPPVDRSEILRYIGAKEETKELAPEIDFCLKEMLPKLTYRACCKEYPVKTENGKIVFPFGKVTSKSLSVNLKGCDFAIIFGATVGIEADRLISKYSLCSPLKACIMQGIGTERAESLCEAFEKDIIKNYGYTLKPRFSPGYGDLSLEFQKEIFSELNLSKNIGLTLKDNLIMAPTKSVTAIIGVKNDNS